MLKEIDMDILVYIIGGILAGVATGLIGLSAATILAPLFATFLGIPVYTAIGIALASDIFASAISTYNYYIHKNIKLRKALLFSITVITFTIVGSYFSKDMNPYNLNSIINIMVLLLGLRFIVFPVKSKKDNVLFKKRKLIIVQTLFFGVLIGMINGYFGAGGGLSMLAVLTMILHYDIKTAVGTSVLIMTVTAFVGASTHIVIGGTNWIALVITSFSALIGANIASKYANKINEVTLNRIIGGLLIIYGTSLLLVYYI
jgi:uncharacterized membrane protein YfcA